MPVARAVKASLVVVVLALVAASLVFTTFDPLWGALGILFVLLVLTMWEHEHPPP